MKMPSIRHARIAHWTLNLMKNPNKTYTTVLTKELSRRPLLKSFPVTNQKEAHKKFVMWYSRIAEDPFAPELPEVLK